MCFRSVVKGYKNYSVRKITLHNGFLYFALVNELLKCDPELEVEKHNGQKRPKHEILFKLQR